ncbi:hypothetical protein PHMEG_00030011 [Phytophthora megakarya]|uniref:Serine/threonine protein kinase n=1 Tax=Phytophthora megakarya TaxID=4795 RepID=A0A225V3R9_9STRA|nr:hypothetical protein PHMEG_00030011 [Phytophthora megakarya]
MDRVAAEGQLEIVKWLHEHCTEDCSAAAMYRAACNGHLKVITWLLNAKLRGHLNAMDAAGNGHLEVPWIGQLHKVIYLLCDDYMKIDPKVAAMNGHLEVVQFLHNHRTEGWTKGFHVKSELVVVRGIRI